MYAMKCCARWCATVGWFGGTCEIFQSIGYVREIGNRIRPETRHIFLEVLLLIRGHGDWWLNIRSGCTVATADCLVC